MCAKVASQSEGERLNVPKVLYFILSDSLHCISVFKLAEINTYFTAHCHNVCLFKEHFTRHFYPSVRPIRIFSPASLSASWLKLKTSPILAWAHPHLLERQNYWLELYSKTEQITGEWHVWNKAPKWSTKICISMWYLSALVPTWLSVLVPISILKLINNRHEKPFHLYVAEFKWEV